MTLYDRVRNAARTSGVPSGTGNGNEEPSGDPNGPDDKRDSARESHPGADVGATPVIASRVSVPPVTGAFLSDRRDTTGIYRIIKSLAPSPLKMKTDGGASQTPSDSGDPGEIPPVAIKESRLSLARAKEEKPPDLFSLPVLTANPSAPFSLARASDKRDIQGGQGGSRPFVAGAKAAGGGEMHPCGADTSLSDRWDTRSPAGIDILNPDDALSSSDKRDGSNGAVTRAPQAVSLAPGEKDLPDATVSLSDNGDVSAPIGSKNCGQEEAFFPSDKRDTRAPIGALVARLSQGGTILASEVIPLLRNWPVFADEVAKLVIGFGQAEARAERRALDRLVVDWINSHLPEGAGAARNAKVCGACGEKLGLAGIDAIPLADGAWVHPRCYDAWQHIRRRQGLTAILLEATR